MKLTLLVVLLSAVTMSLASEQSPYVGEELRDIKSLSATEIASLKNGDGMGFAKLAELNHYPGPRHVLDLESELALTPSQLAETQALFMRMRDKARALGEEMIAAELVLERAFASNDIDARSLESALLEIGELRARIRFAHLEAHLQQKQILTPLQVKHYDKIRGYGISGKAHTGHE